MSDQSVTSLETGGGRREGMRERRGRRGGRGWEEDGGEEGGNKLS